MRSGPSRGDRKARGHHRRAQPSAGDALGRQRRIRSLSGAGKVVADAGGEHWDIAFLAIDPAREATLRFTSPYITIRYRAGQR